MVTQVSDVILESFAQIVEVRLRGCVAYGWLVLGLNVAGNFTPRLALWDFGLELNLSLHRFLLLNLCYLFDKSVVLLVVSCVLELKGVDLFLLLFDLRLCSLEGLFKSIVVPLEFGSSPRVIVLDQIQ